MRLRVVFFGGLQRLAGCREDELEFPADIINIDLFSKHLTKSYPDIAPQMGSVAFSIGDEIVDSSHELRDGDVVGLLPPVSGG